MVKNIKRVEYIEAIDDDAQIWNATVSFMYCHHRAYYWHAPAAMNKNTIHSSNY